MFIPLKLVVIFPFLFLILVIWVFFLPWTISQKLCQLTDLSKQCNFHLLSTSVVFLFSISFIMLQYWLFTMAVYLSLVCYIPYLSFFSKWKSKRVPVKYLLLFYWLCQSLWLCGPQQTGKFLKRWSDHLTCLLRNLYTGQEATVRTGHGTTDWLQIGKGVHQGSILSPCLFNLYAEYIMRNAGLEEAQAGIKIAG